jgi:hypothetical protein
MATSSQAVIPSDPARLLPKFNPNQTFTAPNAALVGTAKGSPSTPATSGLTTDQQSIYDLMAQTLASWGLSDLLADVKKLILQGDTAPDTLALALSQTDAYKQRFAGNEARKAAGLSELTPAQYIALEDQYRQVLQSYGMPKGFYDTNDDFVRFIGHDISPAELQARAQIAHDQFENAPGYVKDLWGEYFGTKGDAIAAILDPDVATSVIQDRARQVGLGGAAGQFGLHIGQSRAQQFDQAGVTLDQARQAYQRISTVMPTDQDIAQRFGSTFSQSDEENDLILGDGKTANRRQSLYNEEEGLFKQHAGLDQNGLGISQSY